MKVFDLLYTEFLKFKKNSVVSLLSILFVVFMPTIIFLGKELDDLPNEFPDNSIFFEMPSMWSYLGYIGNWLVFFFIGLMVIFMITQEVNYKTMRQNVIAGYTRQTFFFTKVGVAVVLCIAATIVYTITGLAIGLTHTEGATLLSAFDNKWAIPRFFLMSMGYCSMGIFIAFVIRKSGISVLLYLCYGIMIEPLLRWGLQFQQLQIRNASINWYPANAFEDLMPFPLFKFAQFFPIKDLGFNILLSTQEAVIVSLIYISLFIGLAYWRFMRKDL